LKQPPHRRSGNAHIVVKWPKYEKVVFQRNLAKKQVWHTTAIFEHNMAHACNYTRHQYLGI